MIRKVLKENLFKKSKLIRLHYIGLYIKMDIVVVYFMEYKKSLLLRKHFPSNSC